MGSIPTRSRQGTAGGDEGAREQREALLILNPAAGRGRAGREVATRLIAAAAQAGWRATVRVTEHPGHERELAAEARRNGWPLVVAIGGDGTVHGVANGLLADGHTDVALGHVPAGNGNDYAKILGFGRRPLTTNLRAVLTGPTCRFDVGRVGGEYFVNALGVGFDAETVRRARSVRGFRGLGLYLVAACMTFLRFEAPDLRVTATDEETRGPLMMVEVGIGTTVGGGFRLLPHAIPDDGWFDVCVIEAVGWLKFLRYLPRVVRGRHGHLPPVRLFRARRVEIAAEGRAVPFHLDGELRDSGAEPIIVEIVPKHLRVRCAH